MEYDYKKVRDELASKNQLDATIELRHRTFVSELFASSVWVFSKMTIPLLLGVIITSCWLIYLAVSNMVAIHVVTVLALLVLIINCVVALINAPDDGEHFGVELSRDDAPIIWETIDRISRHAKCQPITRLIVDGDLNAYASKRNSGGWFKRGELEIGIGLPLMAALEPGEVASVIAHEIGHHNGDDARRAVEIEKAFDRCNRIILLSDTFGFLFRPVGWLFRGYRYALAILSQKLRHNAEFEADNFAARICGVDASARCDVALAVFSEDLTNVIHEPINEALSQAHPLPDRLFDDLPRRFRDALDSSTFKVKLAEALKEETDFWSSHPSVSDRLKNIGGKATLPAFDENRVTARLWLGQHYDRIADAIQAKWAESYSELEPMLADYRDYLTYNRKSLATAERQLEADPRDSEALLIRAQAAEKLLEDDEYEAICLRALDSGVFNPEISLLLAGLEIERGDPAGISRLFEMIEHKAEFHTMHAHEKLEQVVEWAKEAPKDQQDYYAGYYEAASSREVQAAVKQLRRPAHAIFAEQIAHNEGSVARPQFSAWQEELLQDWFYLNSEITRAWLFRYTDDAERILPSYCLLLCFDTQIMSEQFGGFEEADLPLRGVHQTTFFIGQDMPGASFAKKNLPPAVGPILAKTPPFFDRQSAHRSQKDQIAA